MKRIHFVARLCGSENSERAPRIDGHGWQDLIFSCARGFPWFDLQGPGPCTLFGDAGRSGMSAEVDVCLDDGRGSIVVIEAKSTIDYSLPRDAVLVFAGKVRHYEGARRWHRATFNPLLASAGRLTAIVCRWCFFEGIDVIDPDRFPISILARIPYLFQPAIWEALPEPFFHQSLLESLDITAQDAARGPVRVRDAYRRGLLDGERLRDLNQLQAKLSENLWEALCVAEAGGSEPEHEVALLGRLRRDFEARRIQI